MKNAYASVTYLFVKSPEELDLPSDCSDQELEEAMDRYIEEVTNYISEQTDIFHNDCEITVAEGL